MGSEGEAGGLQALDWIADRRQRCERLLPFADAPLIGVKVHEPGAVGGRLAPGRAWQGQACG